MNGKNFNEAPLSFEDFIRPDNIGYPAYNNFFFNLCKCEDWIGKNYELLKLVHPELAQELSIVHCRYNHQGKPYPEHILEKGYEAYLLLRKVFKDDEDLRGIISRYNNHLKGKISDDFPAFFA